MLRQAAWAGRGQVSCGTFDFGQIARDRSTWVEIGRVSGWWLLELSGAISSSVEAGGSYLDRNFAFLIFDLGNRPENSSRIGSVSLG